MELAINFSGAKAARRKKNCGRLRAGSEDLKYAFARAVRFAGFSKLPIRSPCFQGERTYRTQEPKQ